MKTSAHEGYEDKADWADLTRGRAFVLASWACLASAMACTVSVIAAIWIVREGNLGDFSPVQILQFIPANIFLWRTACLSAALATVSFVAFTVAMQSVLELRLQPVLNFAVVLVGIGAANALNAQFAMMILLADLALQMHGHAGLSVHEDITQMSWVTMNHALSQTMLIANSLYTLAGFIIAFCILSSRFFPKWLGWLAMPIWIVTLNVSTLTFIGALQWSLVLSLAAIIAYIMWVTTLGFTLRIMARKPTHASTVTAETKS